jgi:hypothetical protein
MKISYWLATCCFLYTSLGTSFAHADAETDHPRYALSLMPQMFYLTRDNHAPAFSELGFDPPSRFRPAISAIAYWITSTDWQLGIEFTGIYVTHDQGLTEATYHNDDAGVYFAKAFHLNPDRLEVTVGGLIGGSAAIVEVFSSNLNGKLTETSVVLQPSVGVDYQIAKAFKLGLLASYTYTFAESENLKSKDIGVADISLRGVSLGAQLIVGVF